MTPNEEQRDRLALALVQGIGPALVKNLLALCGSAQQVFTERLQTLQKIPGIGPQLSRNLKAKGLFERADQEFRFIEKEGIQWSFMLDDDYPETLQQCPDAPVVVFFKGNIEWQDHRWLAVISTREPTDRGRKVTRKIISMLAERKRQVLIISGLAYGIDIEAHRTALETGLPTIGVLGHGFHTLYPALHRGVAQQMTLNGGLMSDFFSYNKLEPKNFIRRNRIIAGMADAVMVIESGRRGGATTTAEMANSYNRDVLAIPGRIDDEKSKGCNWLIRTHQAALVEECEDVEHFLGFGNDRQDVVQQPPLLFEVLTEEEKQLWDLMPRGPVMIDQLARLQICPVQRIAALLLSMEFKGFVQALPGKRFSKNE